MKKATQTFIAGFAIGIIIGINIVWAVTGMQESKPGQRYWDDYTPLLNTTTHYEKIGECHYIFEVGTLTNEVKRINGNFETRKSERLF